MRSIHQETQESTQRPKKSNQGGNFLDGFSETETRLRCNGGCKLLTMMTEMASRNLKYKHVKFKYLFVPF